MALLIIGVVIVSCIVFVLVAGAAAVAGAWDDWDEVNRGIRRS